MEISTCQFFNVHKLHLGFSLYSQHQQPTKPFFQLHFVTLKNKRKLVSDVLGPITCVAGV